MSQLSPARFVEAHTYAGGLRHTLFGAPSRRPAWLPAADSVGWRDEFELRPEDTVVEFSQRAQNGETVTWLAVYKRSVDSRLGDRSNHAGIGVWISRARIADARALLSSLHEFALALAANPEPDLVSDQVAEFASERFLGSYLVSADALPPDWSGAPSAGSALADTTMAVVVAETFGSALDSISEAVTRWSISWDNAGMTPRKLVRVTNVSADLDQPGFTTLPTAGAFLADVIERIPQAFEAAREAVRTAEASAARDRALLEEKIEALKTEFEEERRRSMMLDESPVTLESIARRLNQLSHQSVEINQRLNTLSVSGRNEPPLRTHGAVRPIYVRSPVSGSTTEEDNPILVYALWALLITLIVIVIVVLVYSLWTGSSDTPNIEIPDSRRTGPLDN